MQLLPLLMVLLLAAELRLLFQTGVGGEDSLAYVHIARNLADGAELAPTELDRWATARVGLYGPVAVMYALFGVSEFTSLSWPFACSILGVAGAYAVGRRLAGEAAGLLAAFLWAVFPTNVAAATAVLGDGPIAALSIATVYFLLVAESTGGFKYAAAMAASVVCLIVGILNKVAILLLVVFLVVYAAWRRPRHLLGWFWLAVIVLSAAAGYLFYFRGGATFEVYSVPPLKALALNAIDWWSVAVMGHPEISWIAPLWIVASAVLLACRRREAYLPLVWFWSMYLYLELGTRSPVSYVPMYVQTFGITRHFLLVAAPAMIATGIYLANGLSTEAARWQTLIIASTTGVVAWVGARQATNLDWGLTGEAVTDIPFAVVSAIATAVVIFGGIFSPAVTTGVPSRAKSISLGLLLGAIGLAALNPIYRAANEHRAPWLETFDEALRVLEKEPPLPILVQNERFGQRLDYYAGFRLGYDSTLRRGGPEARIRLAPEDPKLVREAFVLIDEYYLRVSAAAGWGAGPAYLRNPPPTWAEIARFGDYEGARLKLYRVSNLMAAREYDAARAAVKSGGNVQAFKRLLTAATGAEEFCEAASAWHAMRSADPKSVEGFDPLPLLRECWIRQADRRGPNLLENGDFALGTQHWGRSPQADADVMAERDPQTRKPLVHVKFRGGNWAVLTQSLMLEPNTAYGYTMRVRSQVPIVALYWQAEEGHPFEQNRTYEAWTELVSVFVTPSWSGPTVAYLSPILVQAPGDVWVEDVRLGRFNLVPTVP